MSARNKAGPPTVSRREFARQLAALTVLAAAYPAAALAARRSDEINAQAQPWLADEPWATLGAVQEHLFPATADSPGAADIRAAVYLANSIENPAADGEDREFIFNGVEWLNELTRDMFQQPFTGLDEAQRETALRRIEQSRAGRNWLSLLLTYLFEALLADPVYGGNPDGIGWRWLQHQPGFPAPPHDKTWYKLASPVHFRRKA